MDGSGNRLRLVARRFSFFVLGAAAATLPGSVLAGPADGLRGRGDDTAPGIAIISVLSHRPDAGWERIGTAKPREVLVAQGAMPDTTDDHNTIAVAKAGDARPGERSVRVVLTTRRPFPVTNALPLLRVGDAVVGGEADRSPDGLTMTFTIPEADFDRLEDGAEVSVSMLANAPVWRFGALRK